MSTKNIPETITTARLHLRPMTMQDLDFMHKINSDTRVMSFFPATLSRQETESMIEKIMAHHAEHGFAFMTVTDKTCGTAIGMTGAARFTKEAPFSPAIEIGWRFDPAHWGQGYATEAAQGVVDMLFQSGVTDDVVAFTSHKNIASQRVMERLNMTCDPADGFNHPTVATDHPLQPFVLYRLKIKNSVC